MPANMVYVGRPTKWGNPWKVGMARLPESTPVATVQESVDIFKDWASDSLFGIGRHVPELSGKDLACWCRLDQPCHADALLELANATN